MKQRINPRNIFGRFAVFSGVGVLNTLIHTLFVVSLVEIFDIGSVVSNGVAFVVANLFSYWANGRWSFRVRPSVQQYGRFLIVSFLGLVITLLASGFASWVGWHYAFGMALVFVFLPILSFSLHFLWTFKV